MADYPTGVYSPSAVANGQVIQASRTNNQDAEITAIEDALLNGVTHNVTFNKSVTVSSNLTVTGTVTASSLVQAPLQPRCFVYTLAAGQISTGSFASIQFGVEDYDVGGLHSTTANTDRITVPAGSSGLWQFGTILRFSTGGGPEPVNIRFVKNGSSEVLPRIINLRSSVYVTQIGQTVQMVLDAGDYVTVDAIAITSTGSFQVAANITQACAFWAVKLW